MSTSADGSVKGKVRRAETQLNAVDFEIGFHELLQHPFQVCHRDVFVDSKAFDLVKHRRVCLIIVSAVYTDRGK